MSTDRELLELAAKAAEYADKLSELVDVDSGNDHVCFVLDGKRWNPLTDDGDALRLAVRLQCSIDITDMDVDVCAIGPKEKWCCEDLNIDPYAATRRAIVRAAAELGKEPT